MCTQRAPTTVPAASALVLALSVALAACADDPLVALGGDAGSPPDAAPAAGDDAGPARLDASSPLDSGADGPDAGAPDAAGDDAAAGDSAPAVDAGSVREAPDPGRPPAPGVIDTLTIAVRTSSRTFADTDANGLSLCLTATTCFALNAADVDDFRRGELDSYQLEGIGLPRAAVDRVELRSEDGTDAWRPSCLELRFDGEPVYCNDGLDGLLFGNDNGELGSWQDPQGLHATCTTCWPGVLTHGPMIGGPEPGAVRLWVRTDATRAVALRLSEVPELDHAPVAAWAYPSPKDDYAAVLEVGGLPVETSFFYRVEIDGAPIPGAEGVLATAPPAGAPGRTRIAFGSCSRTEDQPIFGVLSEAAPDLFLFIGDNHYGNTADLDSLRWNYRWALERPERASFVRTTPILATWDDHDFVGNNTAGDAPGKEHALRAFREYWPNPGAGTPAIPGVFFRHAHRDVDIFMLDDRFHRGLQGSILGDAQTAWLEAELIASTAKFKLLVTGSQWTLQGSSDSWAAFPEATTAFFDFLRDSRIDGVVLLSGDVHRAELRTIPRAAAGAYDLPEITSSPLANTNFICPSDSELTACFAGGQYYVMLDLETGLSDPLLIATIHALDGTVLATEVIRRSSLEVP